MDYNQTLNLPKTDFPMRGNVPKREPETLEKWENERLYYKMIEKNQGKPLYVLHDGLPMQTVKFISVQLLTKLLRIL